MGSFRILAINALEETLRRKALYILLFVGLLITLRGIYGLVYMGMAEYAGETELLTQMRGQFVLSMFATMGLAGELLATFLGAVGLSTEIKHRTIVPVLSRPVGRASFFFAKWTGTVAFLILFVGIGAAAALAVSFHWGLHPSPLFALGVAEMILGVAIVSAVSLALSTLFHPVLAGGGALVIVHLPLLMAPWGDHPRAAVRVLVDGASYLSPARSPVALLESGLVKGLLDPDYALYLSVLAENAGYAFAAVLAGALVFRHRELRAR